jgi:hypothetical protein
MERYPACTSDEITRAISPGPMNTFVTARASEGHPWICSGIRSITLSRPIILHRPRSDDLAILSAIALKVAGAAQEKAIPLDRPTRDRSSAGPAACSAGRSNQWSQEAPIIWHSKK